MSAHSSPRPADQDPGRRPLSRRALLARLGLAGVVVAGGYAAGRGLLGAEAVDAVADGRGPQPTPEPEALTGPFDLETFADAVQPGGPPPDGIPPIDDPVYVPAGEGGFLDDGDVVFGLSVDGRPRAYPQLVLVWHEIVNERDRRGPMSVTYCPLTGSAVGFRPHAGIEQLGTSGRLVNSNLLMYDRTHDSRGPQILGRAVDGPRRGDELEEFPLEWTTWGRWRDRHPDSVVLSTDTGYLREYGHDPYGSYNPVSGYYLSDNTRVMFPLLHEDGRFPPKEVSLGAKLGGARLAVRKSLVRDRQVVRAEQAGQPLVFLHDPVLDTGRAFVARVDGQPLDLSPGDVGYVDTTTGSRWDAWGQAVDGPLAGAALQRVHAYDVMWFAWAAFHPHTAVVE